MSNWLRKSEKRKLKKKDHGIVDFAKTTLHYFKDILVQMESLEEPRNQSYIKYSQSVLLGMGILKNVCGVESMRQMEEKFNEDSCLDNLKRLSGNRTLLEIPHSDTLNNYLEKLNPFSLERMKTGMVKQLLRSKSFYPARLLDKYWIVILDGTGLFHFRERHCENCLKRTTIDADGNKKTDYYHKVLEAKLYLNERVIISIGTEFIENESEDVTKQDCERNAAKRLMERIKKEYPRLPICVLGDALYAAEPIMEICRKNNWKYILNCKKGCQKNIMEDYEYLSEEEGHEKKEIGKEKGTAKYVNHVEKVTGKKEEFNVFEYCFERTEKKETRQSRFVWASNIEASGKNLAELIQAGRNRWKIENEGFNNQKKGIYQIEHLNSRNSNAMKNHYILTQIAEILMQLFLAGNKLVKKIKQSIKNTSSRLLESFRRQTVTDEDVTYIHKYTTVHLE